MRWRRGVLVAMLSCVPAAESRDPKGAAGVRIEPSAASRGVPFVTSDGWSVTIDAIALIALVRTGRGGGAFLWNGAERAELVVRAVTVGPVDLSMSIEGRRVEGRAFVVDSFEELHPDPAVRRRLLEPAESGVRMGPPPSLLVAGRAVKEARSVTFDLRIEADALDVVQKTEVRADAVVFVDGELAIERLFMADPETGIASFDDLAGADLQGDGDGLITIEELEAVRLQPGDLHRRVGARAARILRFR